MSKKKARAAKKPRPPKLKPRPIVAEDIEQFIKCHGFKWEAKKLKLNPSLQTFSSGLYAMAQAVFTRTDARDTLRRRVIEAANREIDQSDGKDSHGTIQVSLCADWLTRAVLPMWLERLPGQCGGTTGAAKLRSLHPPDVGVGSGRRVVACQGVVDLPRRRQQRLGNRRGAGDHPSRL